MATVVKSYLQFKDIHEASRYFGEQKARLLEDIRHGAPILKETRNCRIGNREYTAIMNPKVNGVTFVNI